MIKFFRKIRQNLLSQGKTGKYLKYAIGEIVLVVIGILIAISINNWNEKRKIEKNIDRIISLLEVELTQNINIATTFINRGDSIDSLANIYSQNLFTEEFLNKNPDILFTIFATPQTNFEHDHLDALISLERQFPDNYNNLGSLIRFLKGHMEMQLFWENKSMDISLIRFKEFVDTQEWLYKDSNTEEMYAFINTNIFNNKLNHYLEIQNNNIRHISLTRDASVVTLWNIKKLKSKEYPDFNSFIEDLPLKPLFEEECNNQSYKVLNSTFKRNLFIYNNTNNSIFFNIMNKDGQEKRRFNLAEIPSRGLYFGNGFYLRDDELIQVLKNGECYKVYNQDKEDYIVVN